VEKSISLPGLCPQNEETEARYAAWQKHKDEELKLY
jgi:hypothetical protein